MCGILTTYVQINRRTGRLRSTKTFEFWTVMRSWKEFLWMMKFVKVQWQLKAVWIGVLNKFLIQLVKTKSAFWICHMKEVVLKKESMVRKRASRKRLVEFFRVLIDFGVVVTLVLICEGGVVCGMSKLGRSEREGHSLTAGEVSSVSIIEEKLLDNGLSGRGLWMEMR